MSRGISTKTRLTSGFANALAFLSAILEGVIGLLLVLIFTLVANIPFLQTNAWGILIETLVVVMVINYFSLGLILYTPLQELVHYSIKLMLSGFLSLLTILALLITTLSPDLSAYQIYSVLATVIFVVEAIILYSVSSIRSKKLAIILKHKQALDQLSNITSTMAEKIHDKDLYRQLVRTSSQAFATWGQILRGEMLERWDLAKVFNKSIILALFFFGVSYLSQVYYGQEAGLLALISGIATFIVLLGLITIDLVKSQKVRSIL